MCLAKVLWMIIWNGAKVIIYIRIFWLPVTEAQFSLSEKGNVFPHVSGKTGIFITRWRGSGSVLCFFGISQLSFALSPSSSLLHPDRPSPGSQERQPGQLASSRFSNVRRKEILTSGLKKQSRNSHPHYCFQFQLLRVEVEFAFSSVALTINTSWSLALSAGEKAWQSVWTWGHVGRPQQGVSSAGSYRAPLSCG